jgi:hypothetical protein
MMRRELYRVVSELLPRFGGANGLLLAVEQAMRSRCGMAGADNSIHVVESLGDLIDHDDALGQVYQAINSPALENAYRATARERRKFSADEISSVTQLFTPKWVVEFLLHNTLGQLWRQMHPDTRLHWSWLVQGDVASAPPRRAIELRICDPACGTMNFGLVAVDMLRQMYREEIDRAGTAGWPKPSCANAKEIDQAIIQHNLFGFDIDPVAIELARKTLEIKIGDEIHSHQLQVADALFDVKHEGEFDVVVTNPPYLSARNLDPVVVKRLKKCFPSAWRDFYSCFLVKSLRLCRPGGLSGILCMQSFMFTAVFEKLRRQIAEMARVRTAAHFGPGLFSVGNPGTLQTTAVVLERDSSASDPAIFFRLLDADDKESALQNAVAEDASPYRFAISSLQLVSFPRSAWMYWLPKSHREIFRGFPTLGEIAPPKQGLATTDNERFVRYWWEVEPPGFSGPRTRWIPYAKGGRFCRWYESPRHRVDWQDDGARIKQAIVDRYPYLNGQWSWVAKNSQWYGKPGITYSYLTSGIFSARQLDVGTYFDVAGSSLFPEDPLPILGILNSSMAREFLAAINPTVNFQVGDLRLLPLPHVFGAEIRKDVQRAMDLAKQLDRFDETSPDFDQPASWENGGEIQMQLSAVENRIDQVVARLYGLEPDSAARCAISADRKELARRWISFAFGIYIGRWGGGSRGRVARVDRATATEVRNILDGRAGRRAAAEIELAVNGIEQFLCSEFISWHNRIYRGRPVFWAFAGGGRIAVIHAAAADAGPVEEALKSIGAELPYGWQRWMDDGMAVNLAPLAEWISDRKLQKSLREKYRELRDGRLAFSRTSQWVGNRPVNSVSSGESVPLPNSSKPRRANFQTSHR